MKANEENKTQSFVTNNMCVLMRRAVKGFLNLLFYCVEVTAAQATEE